MAERLASTTMFRSAKIYPNRFSKVLAQGNLREPMSFTSPLGPEEEWILDLQLVSRSIERPFDGLGSNPDAVDVKLEVLRRPTWATFKEHLLYKCEPDRYQPVQFDMHGEIVDAETIPS